MSDDLNYWKLCERLTIVQAALLIGGHDPSAYEGNVEDWEANSQPKGYPPTRQALKAAIEAGSLRGELHYDDCEGNGEPYRIFRARESYVEVDDLRRWLASKNVRSGFFASGQDHPRPYMDPSNAHFAPKLAAAVAAWEAVGRAPSEGKSVKQQLEAWARRHANEFGLCDDEGNPVKSAMDTIAIVANWETKGGAPKTPSEKVPTNGEKAPELVLPQGDQRLERTSSKGEKDFELDDEIPF